LVSRFQLAPKWLALFVAAVIVADVLDMIQLTAHAWLTGSEPASAWRMFWWALGEWLGRLWVLPAGLVMVQVFPLEGDRRVRNAVVHVFVSLVFAPFASAVSVPFVIPQFWDALTPLPDIGPRLYLETFAFIMSRYFLATFVLYWLTVGVYQAVTYHRRYIRNLQDSAELQRRSIGLELDLGRARMEALKAQIHPHFIFNTLNAITVLARDGRHGDIVRATTRLAKLLRATIDDNAVVGPLAAELKLVQAYLFIEKLRFGERLSIVWKIDENALALEVPRFSLQPLVENAVKHAAAKSSRPVAVEVGATTNGERLQLWVRDSGAGLGNDTIKEGFGLNNIRSRLHYLYGDQHRLEIRRENGGVCVDLQLPVRSALAPALLG
jgi:hypothetical protein